MKLLPHLLISLTVTAAGIFVYDRMRCGGEGSEAPSAIDEDFLSRLETHLPEINRRRAEKALRTRIERALESAPLELTPAQRTALVDTTMEFQRRLVATHGAKAGPETEAARARVREAYKARVREMLPAEDAEKVFKSPLGRAVGILPLR